MSDTVKPRVRVPAGSSAFTSDSSPIFTRDTFQNFSAQLGYGTNNQTSGSSYGFNPLSRNHVLLEWMYRGSWLVRKVVDCPADDMTREGLSIESDMPPDQIDSFNQYWMNRQIWKRLNATLKWSRLYGGCLAAIMIQGQDPETPLRVDTIRQGQFQGLLVLDRWMVWPHIEDVVTDFGARDFGLPRYYEITAQTRGIPRMKFHHSRIIRFDGVELPYWQRLAENGWGLSILEPMWDRMIAFDSVTQGAAQLVYKAHLRVLKLPELRNLIASGGSLYQAVIRQIQMIRSMQTNEGLTILDGEDEFEANQYAFAGLADMMIQFSQQVSGAADVPMTRLFGQSPAGMNATGDSDLRNYYDATKSSQETDLRPPVTLLLDITFRSHFGQPLPQGFNWSFKPLWQLQESEKTQIATGIAGATAQLLEAGVFTPKTAMKEVRQSSRVTGFGSNITDEDMANAEAQPPAPEMPPMPGQEAGAQPGQEGEGHPAAPGAPAKAAGASAPAAAAASKPPGGPEDDAGGPRPAETIARLLAKRRTGSGKVNGNGTLLHSTHVHLDPGIRAKVKLHEVGTHVNVGDNDPRQQSFDY